MATPRADSYVAASGAAVYAGRSAPSTMPAWLAGKPLNEFFQIANTSVMASGARAECFSGMALKETAGSAVGVVAASGGHNDSGDNRVVAIDLMVDVPGWTVRKPASPVIVKESEYNPNGWPAARHLYWNCTYVPSLDRVMLIGGFSIYANNSNTSNVDGFNLNDNTWDGVVPDNPGASGSGYPDTHASVGNMTGAILNSTTSEVWCVANYFQLWKWSPVTGLMTQTYSGGVELSGPGCWDTNRNQLVLLGGTDGSSIVRASIFNAAGTSRTALTFNPSSAHSALAAAGMATGNLVYDDVGDRFYFFRANEGSGGRVYVITPNAGSTWDIALLTQGAGTQVPPSTGADNYTYSRFRYVKALNGLLYVPASAVANQNCYFMRLR